MIVEASGRFLLGDQLRLGTFQHVFLYESKLVGLRRTDNC